MSCVDIDARRSGIASFARDGDREPTQVGVEDDGVLRLRGLVPGSHYNVFIRRMLAGETITVDEKDGALTFKK